MVKTIKQGMALDLKSINPSDLPYMDKDDRVIVHRIRLNAKLIEFDIKKINSSEVIIVRQALNTMKKKERSSRKTAFGAEMRVGDVIKVFPEYKSLPKNSFAVTDYGNRQVLLPL